MTSSDGSTVDTTKPSLTSVELSPLTGVLRSNYQVCLAKTYSFYKRLLSSRDLIYRSITLTTVKFVSRYTGTLWHFSG